jgi:RNA recognition motif-containing protein
VGPVKNSANRNQYQSNSYNNGPMPSYCFITFATDDDAANAMSYLNGAPFQGSNLKVSPAKGRAPRGDGPPRA